MHDVCSGFYITLMTECLLADFVVEVCNALVGPVFPQRGQDVTQCVRPGDKYVTFKRRFLFCFVLFKNHPGEENKRSVALMGNECHKLKSLKSVM